MSGNAFLPLFRNSQTAGLAVRNIGMEEARIVYMRETAEKQLLVFFSHVVAA
jgi:hypothetical protein